MLDQYIKSRIESGEVKLDMKGHFRLPLGLLTLDEISKLGFHTDHILDRILNTVELILLAYDTDAEAVAIREKLKNYEEIPWFTISRVSCLNDCGECSQDLGYEFNGRIIRAIPGECLNPGGLGPYSVEIPVPSGKLLFANDLRVLVRTDRDYNINQQLEAKLYAEDYARGGMIHFCIGNSCPGVYQISDTSLFVGSEGSAAHDKVWDEDKEEYRDPTAEEVTNATFKEGKKVDSICTDLWAYSAIDYDLAMEICKEMKLKWTHTVEDFFVVDVKPGIYQATALKHTIEEDYDIAQNYSSIEWIRECTEADIPVITADESLTATTLKESFLWKSWRRAVNGKYKNLYPTFTNWLEVKFCVAGSGDGWDNGVITHEGRDTSWFNVDSIKDFDPPSIKGTEFEKKIWTFPQLGFLIRPPMNDMGLGLELDSAQTHKSIYPLSDYSFGPLRGMPYEVNEYYLAAQLTFFATLMKYPKFFSGEHNYSVSKQKKVAKKILDVLYVNVTERGLEKRMLEIFAEFKAAGDELMDVHEKYESNT